MATLLHCSLMLAAGVAATVVAVAWILGSVVGLRLIGIAIVDRVREVLR
jgi:hypothetical protein